MKSFEILKKTEFDLDFISISIGSERFLQSLDELTQKILGGSWRQKDWHSTILWHDRRPGLAIVEFENGGVHQLQFTSKAFAEPDTFSVIQNCLTFYDGQAIKASIKRIDPCLNVIGATPSELLDGRNLEGNLFRRSGVTCSTIGDKSTIYFNSRHYKVRIYDRKKSIAHKISKGKDINLEERNVIRSEAAVTRFEIELRGSAHCAEANLLIRTCVDQYELARKTAAKFLQYNSMIERESGRIDPLWKWLKKDLAPRKRQPKQRVGELVPLTADEKLKRLGASLKNKLNVAGFTDAEKIAFFYRIVREISTERMIFQNEDVGFIDFESLLDFYLKNGPQPEAEGRKG